MRSLIKMGLNSVGNCSTSAHSASPVLAVLKENEGRDRDLSGGSVSRDTEWKAKMEVQPWLCIGAFFDIWLGRRWKHCCVSMSDVLRFRFARTNRGRICDPG